MKNSNDYVSIHLMIFVSAIAVGLAMLICGSVCMSDMWVGLGGGFLSLAMIFLMCGAHHSKVDKKASEAVAPALDVTSTETEKPLQEEPAPQPETPLYRYEVRRIGHADVVVLAANADTDQLETDTVHFTNREGHAIAIYRDVHSVSVAEYLEKK